MKKLLKATLCIAIIALATACCNCRKNRSQAADLAAVTWQLTKLGSESITADGNFELSFRNGQITGIGDCNRFFGGYTDNNGRLTFDKMGVTKAMCANQQLEDRFIAAINATDAYLIEGTTLELLHKGAVVATFKPKE